MSYPALKPRLAGTVLACLTGLADRFDVVICEGAGSPAEINLREHDLANMGLARAAGLPVIVVADIDRGGALAALYGTLALLSRDDQALVAGFVVNKFRGDARLLQPGLDRLREPHRAAGARRAAVDRRAVAGRGGLAQPGRRARRPPPGTRGGRGGGRGRAPGRGDPAAPDQQLHRHRPAGGRAGRGAPVRHLPRRDHRRRPGDPARQPGHRGRPGLAARARAGRRGRRPGRAGRSGARHLRRLPDARRRDPRRRGERRGPGPGAGPAAGHGHVRRARRCSGSARRARTASRSPGTRSTTAWSPRTAASRSPAAAPPGRCWAPRGTGSSRATGSGGRCSAGSPRRPGGPSSPVTSRSPAVRERKLDTLADLVDEHLDTGALLDLIDHGAPAGLPFIPPGAP